MHHALPAVSRWHRLVIDQLPRSPYKSLPMEIAATRVTRTFLFRCNCDFGKGREQKYLRKSFHLAIFRRVTVEGQSPLYELSTQHSPQSGLNYPPNVCLTFFTTKGRFEVLP